MSRSSLSRRWLILALAGFVCACGAGAAHVGAVEVSGQVVDDGAMPPNNGLAGVTVKVQVGTEEPPNFLAGVVVISDGAGGFSVSGVPPGQVVLHFEKQNYILLPTKVPLKVGDQDVKARPVRMMREEPDPAYDAAVARTIVSIVAESQNRRGAYAYEWRRLRAINVLPTRKWGLARQIAELDAAVREDLPPINEYLRVELPGLERALAEFSRGLMGEAAVPRPEAVKDLGVGDGISVDIILSVARDTSQPAERRLGFLRQCHENWGATPQWRELTAWAAMDNGISNDETWRPAYYSWQIRGIEEWTRDASPPRRFD